jgi:SAM-dependent methyltransferase
MIEKAKENYPEYDFVEGDALDAMQFQSQSFTHILCLYFTLYYIKDKSQFFNNCMNWLMPGGSLVVHVVNRDMFDPILPPSNPLVMLTPQRYAKDRITNSKVTFEDFKYVANFDLDNKKNAAKFVERFQNKEDGKVFRKQEHLMYMEPENDILTMAKTAGFIMKGKIDLIKAGYEYQYLYILQKPA